MKRKNTCLKPMAAVLASLLLFISLPLSGCSAVLTSEGRPPAGVVPEAASETSSASVTEPITGTDPEKTTEIKAGEAVSELKTSESETAAESKEKDSKSFLSEKRKAYTFAELDREIKKRLTVDLITPSEFSRAGNILTKVNAVAVHYLANPGSTAKDNRDYFNSLAESHAEYASCHFVIGLDGEIIQLIPINEISLATNDRNMDSISIECCHPDETGVLNEKTYDSLVLLTAWLLDQLHLTYKDIIRHFDANGKICPLAFVVDPDYYYQFKTDVANTMGSYVTIDVVRAVCKDRFLTQEEVDREFNAEKKAEEVREAELNAEYDDGEYYYDEYYDDGEYYDDEYYYDDGEYYDDGYYYEEEYYDEGY